MSQFSRFLFVGIANTVFGYAVIFSCMYLAEISPELSNVIGYSVGVLISYSLNRHFTFRSVKQWGAEFVRFVLCFLTAYSFNLMVLVVLIRIFAFHAGLSQIIAGSIYIVVTYMLNKYYVFRVNKKIKF